MDCEIKWMGYNSFHAPGSSFLQCITAREGCCPIVWMLSLVGPKRSSRIKKNIIVAQMLRGMKSVAQNMQLLLMARSHPRILVVALRHCGKDGVEEASLQSTPARQRLWDVRGKFLPLAAGDPVLHAIGLTLGRLMVWLFVNGIPRADMTGL